MADKTGIQSRLMEATGNAELAQSIATALCDGEGYRNIPEETVALMEISAKKAASDLETAHSIGSFKAAAGVMPAIGAYGIPAFESLDGFLTLLLGEARYTSGAVIYGSAGVGKTMRVLNKLAAVGVDYAYFNTYSTPLSLVEIMFRNNGRTIVLDDVNNLLKDPKAVAILKAATFSATGQRLVTYSSTSKVMEEHGIPSSFVFTGRIVIILNEIPATLRETFQALMSRMYAHEVVLSLEEKKHLIREVFKGEVFALSEVDKGALLDYIETAAEFSNAHKYNVRSALRAAEMVSKLGSARARILILDLLECDLRLRAFLMIEEKGSKAGLPVERRVEIWGKTTGYSRRSYFEVKAKYYGTYYGRGAHEAEISSEIDRLILG